MSFKTGKDYLYLIWQDKVSRRQYIVGQLSKNGQYEFCYSNEIKDALEAGFKPLVPFDDLNKTYYSDTLFSTFSSRLPDKKRKDIRKILEKYGLQEYDAYALLKASGARLPIDSLHFVDPILDISTAFDRGDQLFLKKEPDNKQDAYAIEIMTGNNKRVGYIPRYYSKAFTRLLDENREIVCHVKRIEKNKPCSECVTLHIEVSAIA